MEITMLENTKGTVIKVVGVGGAETDAPTGDGDVAATAESTDAVGVGVNLIVDSVKGGRANGGKRGTGVGVGGRVAALAPAPGGREFAALRVAPVQRQAQASGCCP